MVPEGVVANFLRPSHKQLPSGVDRPGLAQFGYRMSRYEAIIEFDSDLGQALLGEIFSQMLDDYGYESASLSVMRIDE